jgi:hypothetical protein
MAERCTEKDGSPSMPEDEGASHILPLENGLDRYDIGLVSVKDSLDLEEDLANPIGTGSLCRGSHDSAFDQGKPPIF